MEGLPGSQLYVRYVGANQENSSEVNLADLALSLYGFQQIFDDFSKICRLNGELVVTAMPPEEGSFVLGICVDLKLGFNQLPFEHVKHLLDFMRLCGTDACQSVHEFYRDLKDLNDGLNQYFAKYPFNVAAVTYVLSKLIDKAKKLKKSPIVDDDELSKRVAKELHTMIKKNRFKNMLRPITNESVKSIEVSPNRKFDKASAIITDENLEQLLTDDNEILPELGNGDICDLTGIITSLKSTRGDSLTLQYTGQSGTFNLEVIPQSGHTTKNYVKFYKENVIVSAEVMRTTMFKKPKLKMLGITYAQPSLPHLSELYIKISEPIGDDSDNKSKLEIPYFEKDE